MSLAKFVELTFSSKSNLHCVKDYIYIQMPMPIFPNRPQISYKDFEKSQLCINFIVFKYYNDQFLIYLSGFFKTKTIFTLEKVSRD